MKLPLDIGLLLHERYLRKMGQGLILHRMESAGAEARDSNIRLISHHSLPSTHQVHSITVLIQDRFLFLLLNTIQKELNLCHLKIYRSIYLFHCIIIFSSNFSVRDWVTGQQHLRIYEENSHIQQKRLKS